MKKNSKGKRVLRGSPEQQSLEEDRVLSNVYLEGV
jgi:hypothetical protein